MIRITPQQFKDAFLAVITAAQGELITRWDVPRDYTSFMRGTILPAVAPSLGLHVYSGEYYTLDCIYFAESDAEHFGSLATYATSISIALEHENFISGTATEMNKLQLFNAPLKVLITYSQSESERAFYLQRY